jgi:CheY-like chemotaxis protein
MPQRTILIVDDEANIPSVLLRAIRKEEVRIPTASSPQEALAILQKELASRGS